VTALAQFDGHGGRRFLRLLRSHQQWDATPEQATGQ